jgi:hypothetical protein
MRQYIKSYILLILILFTTGFANAQTGCDLLKKLNDDIAEAGSSLRPFFESPANNGGEGIKAWSKLIKFSNTRKKIQWIEGFKKFIDEGYQITENTTSVVVKSGDDVVVEVVNDIPKLTKHKIVPKPDSEVIKKASDVNPTFPSNWEAPYSNSFPAIEFKTVSTEKFVRVYKSGPNANPEGRWLVKKSDIEGMTPQQIKDFLAIPNEVPGIPDLPNMIIDVDIPPNILLRTGIAAPTSGGAGGAIQFDIPIEQAKSSSWYSNPRPL